MKDNGWMGLNNPIPHKKLSKGERYDVLLKTGHRVSGVFACRVLWVHTLVFEIAGKRQLLSSKVNVFKIDDPYQ